MLRILLSRRINRVACASSSLVIMPLLLTLGCGRSSGPARYKLSGQVTHNGQPLPAGSIMFEPDTSQGNSGPGAMAVVKNGKYATESGKGTVGGPHIARITGYDGNPADGSEAELKPFGNVLFGPREFKLDIPKSASTHDFAVPAGN